MKNLTIPVVGSQNSYKAYLLGTLNGETYGEEYIPTVYQSITLNYSLNEKEMFRVTLLDTSGNETVNSSVGNEYHNPDIFIVCINLADEESLRFVENYVLPNRAKYCPATPILFVLLKKNDSEHDFIDEYSLKNLYSKTNSKYEVRSTTLNRPEELKKILSDVVELYNKVSPATPPDDSSNGCCILL